MTTQAQASARVKVSLGGLIWMLALIGVYVIRIYRFQRYKL